MLKTTSKVNCRQIAGIVTAIVTSWGIVQVGAAERTWQSHPPARPLAEPSQRAMAAGPAFFVDPVKGDDSAAGSQVQPWRTLGHGMKQLRPGDTLYLRGGVYHEHVSATLLGTAEKPITLAGYPGELAVLDGGIAEFLETPQTAWEPCTTGVAGEFWSTKTYPDLEQREGELRVGLLGRFADSMTPLHGYWHHPDLQSDNPYWTLGGGEKVKPDAHVYCGPGLWYDPATDRIHCRLAHTQLPGLGDDNYRGETDPRKLALVIAGWRHGSVLTLEDSQHVRLQDLVVRGARQPTVQILGGHHVDLDGLTVYGGQACLKVDGVQGFRMVHTACRGLAAPWTFRGSLKYRSIESRLFTTGGWDPTGADGRFYEMTYCEFTDSVDGIFIGNIFGVSFDHNLVENVSDDGIFLTAATGYDGQTPGGAVTIEHNRFARCLTCFAFGVGHARQRTIEDVSKGKWGTRQTGRGVVISRNVFDFRRPVLYHWPTGPNEKQEIDFLGRFAGDHGSPAWEPMLIHNNTLITGDPPRYEYGTDGFSRAVASTTRGVANNLICQLHGLPGNWLPPGEAHYSADHNLMWTVDEQARATPAVKPRYPRDQIPPPAEWAAHDQFVDPKFVSFDADWRKPIDLRLRAESPAIDAGRETEQRSNLQAAPSLRTLDQGLPDIGAIPLGAPMWPVGVYGRLDVGGNPLEINRELSLNRQLDFDLVDRSDKQVAVVTGYPAFDAPLVAYALRKRGRKVVEFEKQWLDPREYAKYEAVVIDGSFARAGLKTTKFADDELPIVRKYLEEGGTLWLFRDRHDVFASDAGKQMLEQLVGKQTRDSSKEFVVRLPDDGWIAHFGKSGADLAWLAKAQGGLQLSQGDALIATPAGRAILGRVKIGKGNLIYVGWSPAAATPHGRNSAVTVADEKAFADQMLVITRIAETVCK